MYLAISTVLFLVGLSGLVVGYVDRDVLTLVLGFLSALAGVLGLADVFGSKRAQGY